MKKRLLLTLVVLAVVICAISILAFTASAETEQITVSFMNGINSTTLDKAVATDGVLTVGAGEKFVLPVKEVDTGYALVWATPEGKAWSAGEEVSFSEDTTLYQFKALEVDTVDAMKNAVKNGTAVKLMSDMVSESGKISTKNQGITNFFMNGHTLTIQNTDRGFEEERAGRRFYGEGRIVFEPNNTSGTGAHLFRMHSHGYAGHNNYLFVGADIVIEAANAILGQDTNSGQTGYPTMDIYGKVTAYRLLHMEKSGERKPNVNIYEGAEVTLTGPSITATGTYSGTVNVTIKGGTLIFNAEGATVFSSNTNPNNDNNEFNIFNITGGSFALIDSEVDALKALLTDEYTVITNETSSYNFVTVVPSACAHDYEKTEFESTCTTSGRTVFKCAACLDSFYIESGEKKPHDFEQISDIPATPTEAGLKTLACKNCGAKIEQKYSYDPSLVNIDIIVNTGDGEKKISASVTDVFVLEATGSEGAYSYTITGIKEFGDYLVQDIVAVNVPACISAINFTSDAGALKAIYIEDSAKISIYSFAKLSALETISIGASNVAFKAGCANSVIKNILSNKEGAYVNYEAKAFSKILSLEKVTFSTNSDYILAAEAFGDCTGIKEIVFPDYSRPQFTGSAFWQNNIEYIYVGRGIKSLNNDPFNRNYKLKKAVLMEVNSLPADYTFCWSYDWANDNDPTTGPAEIYFHSSELSLAGNAFYQSHGITIYTNAPITHGSAFSGCQSKTVDGVTYPAYTIVYGIPHKLVEATSEADSCTETGLKGYKGDCPCGEFVKGSVTVKVFKGQKTNSSTYEEITYTTEEIPGTGHKEGTVINVAYNNGYMSAGVKTYICADCSNECTEETPSAEALFTFLGYSMPEDGELVLTIGFAVNSKAVEAYEKANNTKLEYGVVCAISEKLDGKAPLDSTLTGVSIVKAPVDKTYGAFNFVLSGFTDELLDLELVMAAYVIDGENTVYLQKEQTNMPSSISINKYLAENIPA
ncbi:MAG: leucine-rich repeat protein [Clostridia bacterium]|nr:leucine-rich repeat protein [Clostridia bacterium]